MRPLIVQHRGRQEHRFKSQPLRSGVRRLDHAKRGEIPILREHHHRTRERNVALRILDRDFGRVPVADQMHSRASNVQRLVDLENLLARSCPRPLSHLDIGAEQSGCSALHRAGFEPHVEVLHRDAERRQIGRTELSAGREIVILGEVVGEALTDDDHAGASETEQHADCHSNQYEDQADVEHQIAGFAQVAPLGRHAVGIDVNSVAPATERGCGAVQNAVILIGNIRRGVRGQPAEVARSFGRPRPQRPGVHANPRNDAADERNEEQQIDRREPWRGVDAEQPDLVVDRSERGMVVEKLRNPDRRYPALRHQRTRDSGERKRKQQDQRRTH